MNIKTYFIMAVLFFVSLPVAANVTYPQFDKEYWEQEQDKSSGKILRGAGLVALGVGAMIPSAIWIHKASDNPGKFTALGTVASIAAISMTLHGINSIVFGKEQKDKSSYFINKYKNDPAAISTDEEQDYYIYARKKSAIKLVMFGSILTAQAALLLTNGAILTARKVRNKDIGGALLWPSYVFGGLMMAAGLFVIIQNALLINDLKKLELSAPLEIQNVSITPWFYHSPDGRGQNAAGLSGQFTF